MDCSQESAPRYETPEGYVRLFRTSYMPEGQDGNFDVRTEYFNNREDAESFAEVFQHNYFTPGTVIAADNGKFYVECKNVEKRMLGTDFIEDPLTCIVENIKNPYRGKDKAAVFFEKKKADGRKKAIAKYARFAYPLCCLIAALTALVVIIVSQNKFSAAVLSLPVVLVFCVCTRQRGKRKYSVYSWAEIDRMRGRDFERFVGNLIVQHGFGCVKDTPVTGDFGVDIILNGRTAIQCKRSAKNLGIKPLQEVYAGMKHYGCIEAIVVTNAYFTKNAIELARELGIVLWDRNVLSGMM